MDANTDKHYADKNVRYDFGSKIKSENYGLLCFFVETFENF